MHRLWSAAGLDAISQREIVVTRTFLDFDEYWQAAFSSPRLAMVLEGMSDKVLGELRESVRADLRVSTDGSIVPSARANAISGRVPL
jgi:hypothetical protein